MLSVKIFPCSMLCIIIQCCSYTLLLRPRTYLLIDWQINQLQWIYKKQHSWEWQNLEREQQGGMWICQASNTRYGCSFCRVQYNFHSPTAITPMATATENPPKNDPVSNFRCEPGVALVAIVGDGDAVVRIPSVGHPHTTGKKLRATIRRQLATGKLHEI